jgi:hypothetical protein
MKRTIALLLVLVLACGLLGCGKEEPEIGGKVTPVTEAATAPAGKVEAVPETTEATEAAPEDKTVSLGRIEGGVYTNEYIGIGCTLDTNWSFYTAEELQELPAQTSELLQDTEYSDATLRQITDMMAENVNDMSNMNIQYTKLNMQERLVYATMDYEAFADMILGESASMAEAYAQAGIENAVLEKVTVNYLGEERVAIRTSATIQGYPYYILQVFEHDIGQYYVTITFSSLFEDTTQSMLDLFYKLN